MEAEVRVPLEERRIFTHGGRAHADDFLAVSLLLTKFPDARVHRVSQLPENLPESSIIVDIGGVYDGKRFFDHHQDRNLPASIVLVLKDVFGIDVDEVPEIQWVSDWDTKGPFATQKAWNVKLPEFNVDTIGSVLIDEFSEREIVEPGDPLHTTMRVIGQRLLKFIDEQREFIEKAKKAEVFEVKGLRVVRTQENVPIRFIKQVHRDVAVVVQPNQRTKGAMTLTRVDDHPRVDFRRIKVPAHFVHATGFMAVVDPEFVREAVEQAIE